MRRPWFIAATAVSLGMATPATACRIPLGLDPDDIQYADVVVVGRITGYQIVRDPDFEVRRLRMLAQPDLPPVMREIYSKKRLLPDYPRFEIRVDEVLKGDAADLLIATWDNSTFQEPEEMGDGQFLIALREPSSPAPPMRGPSATILSNRDPAPFTVLQAACAPAFIFEVGSERATGVRAILEETAE